MLEPRANILKKMERDPNRLHTLNFFAGDHSFVRLRHEDRPCVLLIDEIDKVDRLRSCSGNPQCLADNGAETRNDNRRQRFLLLC